MDTTAFVEILTSYIQDNCFALPSDFEPTFINGMIAKPIFSPYFIWIVFAATGFIVRDVYLGLLGLWFILDFAVLNPSFKSWIGEAPPVPGCGGTNGSPSTVAEQLVILYVVIYTFSFFYRAKRMDKALVLLLVIVWAHATSSLIYIGMSSARQILVACYFGIAVALVFQFGVFYLIFPAYQRDPWNHYRGAAKWVSWPALYMFHVFGKEMKIASKYNTYFVDEEMQESERDAPMMIEPPMLPRTLL